MKKSLIISSLLGLSGAAFGQTSKVQRIYIDPTGPNFQTTMNAFKRLKDANILLPTEHGWIINKENLKNEELNLDSEIQSLREILGPGIEIEQADGFNLVLASQDIRMPR